jgi:hypothetical protein
MHQFQESIRPSEGIPDSLQSNCEHQRQPRERQRQGWEHLETPATKLGIPGNASNQAGSASNLSGSTSNHSRAVWENYIFFGKPAGVPANHSYYLSFNDCKNSCIQFASSSMYLCIYIATQVHTVNLDWLQPVFERNSRRA